MPPIVYNLINLPITILNYILSYRDNDRKVISLNLMTLPLDIIKYIMIFLDITSVLRLRLICKKQHTIVEKELCRLYKKYISTNDCDMIDTIKRYGSLATFFAALPKIPIFLYNYHILEPELIKTYTDNPLLFLETFQFGNNRITGRLIQNIYLLTDEHFTIFLKRMVDARIKGTSRELAISGNIEVYLYARVTNKRKTLRSIMNDITYAKNYTNELIDSIWTILSQEKREELLKITYDILETVNRDYVTSDGMMIDSYNWKDQDDVEKDILQLIYIRLRVAKLLDITRSDALTPFPNILTFANINDI